MMGSSMKKISAYWCRNWLRFTRGNKLLQSRPKIWRLRSWKS